MILSRIDQRSHDRASLLDADRIMKIHLLPKSIPWHKPPAPLLRTVPRDIEDMPGVLYSGIEEEKTAPFLLDRGPHGFGLFDQGGKKSVSTNGKRLESKAVPFQRCDKMTAAARRSYDPGVIDLNVKMPPPSSLESIIVGCQDHGIIPFDPMMNYSEKDIAKAKAFVNAERAETASLMPFYWKTLDGSSFFNPPGFLSDDSFDEESDDDSSAEGELLYRRIEKKSRKRNKYKDVSKLCVRNWRVSVKLEGVSSRASLFKKGKETTNSNLKAPMLMAATLPSPLQTGSSAIDNNTTEVDGMIQNKPGRNTLLWSRVRNNNGSKTSYNSMLTGQRLEQNAVKVCFTFSMLHFHTRSQQ